MIQRLPSSRRKHTICNCLIQRLPSSRRKHTIRVLVPDWLTGGITRRGRSIREAGVHFAAIIGSTLHQFIQCREQDFRRRSEQEISEGEPSPRSVLTPWRKLANPSSMVVSSQPAFDPSSGKMYLMICNILASAGLPLMGSREWQPH